MLQILQQLALTVFDSTQPRRSEVVIAKNYLTEEELATLNRMVSAFLDLAELRAMQHVPMYMKDWIAEKAQRNLEHLGVHALVRTEVLRKASRTLAYI